MKPIITISLLMAISSAATAQHNFNNTDNQKIIAGYLDTTAGGSAESVDMHQAVTDGYNMAIFGFGQTNTNDPTTVGFYSQNDSKAMQQGLAAAKQNNLKALISFGGATHTFNPGSLSAEQTKTLAQNIVKFANDNGFDGVDFDQETHIDPTLFANLVKAIRAADANIIISIAPQVYDNQLVTTGTNQDYNQAIATSAIDYILVQEYNSPNESDVGFISKTYPMIKSLIPTSAKTKIVIGEPTDYVGANKSSIYYPSGVKAITTEAATASMLPELKKINTDSNFGGAMGWSLNIDYDAQAYSDPNHTAGSYAYGLKDCIYNNTCDTPPPPKPPVANYTLQASDTDKSSGLGIVMRIQTFGGTGLLTDYIAPGTNKVYSNSTNPSVNNLQNVKKILVLWKTYNGGPSGLCSGSFDLTSNMNIMVNPTTKTCQFSKL